MLVKITSKVNYVLLFSQRVRENIEHLSILCFGNMLEDRAGDGENWQDSLRTFQAVCENTLRQTGRFPTRQNAIKTQQKGENSPGSTELFRGLREFL